jgi:hypothetical protein
VPSFFPIRFCWIIFYFASLAQQKYLPDACGGFATFVGHQRNARELYLRASIT